MPNILQMQEILKGIPDNKLMEEMQQPSGSAPSFLVMTELERRKKVRDEYQGRMQEEQTTVAEDIVTPQLPQGQPPASGGIASLQPQATPPMAPPMRMESGGDIYMQTGGVLEREDDFVDMLGTIDRDLLARMVEAEAGGESEEGKKAVASVIVNRILSGNFPNTLEGVLEERSSGDNYQFSPLNNLKGDLSKLGEATEKTEDVIEELLMDFGNQNPVGNAVLFQNPDSASPFPIMKQDKSAGKKIGNHVFYDRYSINDAVNDFSSYYGKTPVEEIATVNNQQFPELAKKSNISLGEIGSKISDGIASLLSFTDSPNVAEIDQSASVPSDINSFKTKSRDQVIQETLKKLALKTPDASLDVAAYQPDFGLGPVPNSGSGPVSGPDPDPVVASLPIVEGDRSTAEFLEDPIQANMLKERYENQKAGRSLIPETVAAPPPVNALPPVAASPVDNSYADMIEQLKLGREDAKNMGLLTAGLGIMQQASQPGATLLSSIPGAAAGIKQYGADTDRLAKRQLALATLANQKRTADLAAQKLATGTDYRFGRTQLLSAVMNDPKLRGLYISPDGKPNQAFEEYAIKKLMRQSTLDPTSQFIAKDMLAKKTWLATQPTTFLLGIRQQVRKDNPKLSIAEINSKVESIIDEQWQKAKAKVTNPGGISSNKKKRDLSFFNN